MNTKTIARISRRSSEGASALIRHKWRAARFVPLATTAAAGAAWCRWRRPPPHGRLGAAGAALSATYLVGRHACVGAFLLFAGALRAVRLRRDSVDRASADHEQRASVGAGEGEVLRLLRQDNGSERRAFR